MGDISTSIGEIQKFRHVKHASYILIHVLVLHALYKYVESLDMMNMCLMGCESSKDKFVMLYNVLHVRRCHKL